MRQKLCENFHGHLCTFVAVSSDKRDIKEGKRKMLLKKDIEKQRERYRERSRESKRKI